MKKYGVSFINYIIMQDIGAIKMEYLFVMKMQYYAIIIQNFGSEIFISPGEKSIPYKLLIIKKFIKINKFKTF